MRQIHVAAGQRQDGLLSRNPPYKRREFEIQAPYGIPKFIDIREAKYSGRQPGRIINTIHGNMKRSIATDARPATMPVQFLPFGCPVSPKESS
ncbi:hypothetical protein [Bradyrhizobium sp. LB11.1]|uniref:hypothetical protein n=1 Tax=Bradyrhizobium sp. LB11.1 TaxID=3156326 RepID=UPI0033997B79